LTQSDSRSRQRTGRTYVTDLTHLPDPLDPDPRIPEPARRLAEYLGSIVEKASLYFPKQWGETNMRRRRRPGRQRCPGRIHVRIGKEDPPGPGSVNCCRPGRERRPIPRSEESRRRSDPREGFHPLPLATESPCRLRNIRGSTCFACRASASKELTGIGRIFPVGSWSRPHQ